MVVVILSLVLLELVLEVDLLNSVMLLSWDWHWCVFVVEMNIVILIVVGVVNVLGVANSSCGQRDNAHMMTGAPSRIQYTTFPVQ
jgi:hypothetical protein